MNAATQTITTANDLLMFAADVGAGVDVVRDYTGGRFLLLITLGDRAVVFDCDSNTGHDGLALRCGEQETPITLADAIDLVHARIAAVTARGRAHVAEQAAYNMMGVA